MKVLRAIFNSTLNSVYFGILLMVLTAGYIAIGSGLPRVREAFEMNEMEFFNAWPLKVLMGLLVANLMTVTWIRIPLTWPRAGVWMIHSGIIMLIVGTSFYYRFKVEGQIHILKGQTVSGFYDKFDRALYVRLDGRTLITELPLLDLPRFKTYLPGQVPLSEDLGNIELNAWFADGQGGATNRSVASLLNLPNLSVDVLGFFPYAEVVSEYGEDPSSNLTGISVVTPGAHGKTDSERWLIGSDPRRHADDLGGIILEHHHLPGTTAAAIIEAAGKMHRLVIKAGDFAQDMFVKIGQTYPLGDSGYTISVENFNPSFPLSGTGEMVQVLTLLVKNAKADAPEKEFRRMVINGRPLQTDFKLGEPGAGPMGKRQKEPLDNILRINYTFADGTMLLHGEGGGERHVFVTTDEPGITHFLIGDNSSVTPVPLSDKGEFAVGPAVGNLKLIARRVDHLKRTESVREVPSAQRQREVGETGASAVLVVRVKSGEWQQIINVPYVSFAREPNAPWDIAQMIDLPSTTSTLQIGLGHRWRKLPAQLTLENFELVSYPGGTQQDNLFRDFKSTLKVRDRATGKEFTAVAQMNSPIYFDRGNWLFFQQGWLRQTMSTFIGVGNRPFVGVMVAGCVMMTIGLLWAFYVKPVIIRRRKQAAIAAAKAAGRFKSDTVAEAVS